jgi:3-oxoacyl-[acyl-carrier-protein] synthase-1
MTGSRPNIRTTSTQRDPALRSLVEENRMQPLQRVLTNSFGFGGNNCALIFGAMQ